MYNGALPSTDVSHHVREVVVHFAVGGQLTNAGSANFPKYNPSVPDRRDEVWAFEFPGLASDETTKLNLT